MRYKKYGKHERVPGMQQTPEVVEDAPDQEPATDATPLDFILDDEAGKGKKKGHKGLITFIIIIVLLAAAAAVFFRVGDKFHDITVEAGVSQISIDDFLALKYYKPFSTIEKADVDLNKVGDYPVTLSMAGKTETVTLHVVDTTPPEVMFKNIVRGTGYQPVAEDFIESVSDYSQTKTSITSMLPDTSKYGGSKVKIVVTDEYGNETSESPNLTISWLKDSALVELGSEDMVSQLAFHPESEAKFFTEEMLSKIDVNNAGDYELAVDHNGQTLTCKVHVADTTPPQMELRNVTVYYERTEPVTIDDFIVNISDNSGIYKTELLTELAQQGRSSQDVIIRASDPSGNTIEQTVRYVRGDDMDPPEFSGLSDMSVEKNAEPDYTTGVTAIDRVDGELEFKVDDSEVDLTKAGTYFVTYTVEDKSGNEATASRKIVVEHDEEDTKALIKLIAEQCGDDFEAMRAMVQNIVYVTAEYGGDDPVWVGFTTWRGNCLVHAMCYKALLDYFGYDNQIIHCKDLADGPYYSHYWNLVYTERDGVEGWWHTDGTPGPWHGPTPTLASDEERFETLQNGYEGRYTRDWNRDEWPATPK